ncbi:hypothetical protein DFP72DRAFT_615698 [Ephemerocybe angulata]|uniref:DUF7330 domain-containing protein n=1 Tax=Ephemerocybe angulata TaxID=980116 RepID=A0A8H6HGZ1_9AGAR|nr:hypothetical protein DFP72DRAFT_615698 [Tulosesus angulatus]
MFHHPDRISRDSRPHSRSSVFDIPVASDSLYFRSEGPWSSGDLTVISSADQDRSTLSILVVIEYYDESALNLFRVCAMSRRSGEMGVGVFTPADLCRCAGCLRSVRVKTTIILPRGEHLSPLWIKELETDVDNTDIAVDVDKEYLCFDSLKLCATNGDVSSTAPMCMTEGFVETESGDISGTFIATKNLAIKTSNGSVEGRYISSGSLDISTTNGPIQEATFVLENKDASKANELRLETSDGPIEADIYLEGDTGNPMYEITARTSNGALDMSIKAMPLDSTLIFSGKSSNDSAYLSLPAAYEGSFNVKTSSDRVKLVKRTRTDPKGAGRTRVWRNSSPGFRETNVSGSAYWSEGREESEIANGSVTLLTSNAKATLEI